jgi:hypothetical protein
MNLILYYLKIITDVGLVHNKNSITDVGLVHNKSNIIRSSVERFIDSEYVNDLDRRRSLIGYVFTFKVLF